MDSSMQRSGQRAIGIDWNLRQALNRKDVRKDSTWEVVKVKASGLVVTITSRGKFVSPWVDQWIHHTG